MVRCLGCHDTFADSEALEEHRAREDCRDVGDAWNLDGGGR